MNNSLYDSKLVAKNTLYLYFRTLFVMGVSIFTSRIILDTLGIADYGIYNVVGGFVAMFSMLSGTLTAATQRFIAYELGKDNPQIKKIFSTTLNIHIILAIIIFILLESIGIWFLNHKMNISPERIVAANWVFQCSVLTFSINLISIPYNAAIIAYEKMSAFAYISIIEVLSKLLTVYILYIIAFDSLITYAIFMLIISINLRIIYSWYCHKTFKECRYSFILDKQTYREMIGFCGWNFIGSTASVMNGQGINILINLFFGVTLNATRGIATQIDSAINTFVTNFMMALNPQITKSYAAGNFEYVNKMIILGSKYSFFLFWIICLPIYLNTDYLLQVWLKQIPQHASLFIRFTIIYSLCQSLSQCLYTAMLASGKIKKYQIIVGTISIMSFPLAFLFFKLGLPGEYGYISMIICSLLCFIARLWLLQNMIQGFSAIIFLKKVLLPIILTILPTICIISIIHYIINTINFITFITETGICCCICFIFIFYIGLTSSERNYITKIVKEKIIK